METQKSQAKLKTHLIPAQHSQAEIYLINPTYINIPDWQRDTDNAKTTEIAENFEECEI